MEDIAAETNRYAKQSLEAALSKGSVGPHSRLRMFKDTNTDELYAFFALILAAGIAFKSDLTEYWTVKGKQQINVLNKDSISQTTI
ncbi:unnamed protein product [Parnassius apollo]|uniref:(apollo) hypothetical protein n=1 Tax=Parnassius apollo TaxID=110799 RepID=A0A8S3Y488_PARAO|nr:unnamed protein product [Parnassius apollo]